MAAQKPRKKPRARRSPNNAFVLRLTPNQTDDVSLLFKRQQQALIKLAKTAKHMPIRALFSGPSGAGKTSAAQFLARKLDLELYRIEGVPASQGPFGELRSTKSLWKSERSRVATAN